MSIASPEREATETATIETIQTIEGATSSISAGWTLDELLGAAATRRAEEARQRAEARRQGETQALEKCREFFASVLDETTRNALGLTYAYSDELGPVATFIVDGATWRMWTVHSHVSYVRLQDPDYAIMDFSTSEFAHTLLGQLLDWRERQAGEKTPKAAPEPVVLYADVARGVKAYIIGAESACGGLDQLRFTLARFTRSGDVEVERYDANTREAHSHDRGTWERFSLPSGLAGQLASLRAAWLEETKTQPRAGDDGIPF